MDIKSELQSAIESDLQNIVKSNCPPDLAQFAEMIYWHMGWFSSAVPQTAGKRLRPLFLLLVCQITGGDWREALPAASALELIHNFTLIHDDIQDNSEIRHGRVTLWHKYGMAQAINTGDAMHALGMVSVARLSCFFPPKTVLAVCNLIERTVYDLAIGQHQDMSFQNNALISADEYIQMVRGKTGALLSACFEIGSILGATDNATIKMFSQIGMDLGIAFQIQDDYIGIWGDPAVTGKSDLSDLSSRKVTLPIVMSLGKNGQFAELWNSSGNDSSSLLAMKRVLEDDGSDGISRELSNKYLNNVIKSMTGLKHQDDVYFNALNNLIQGLFNRIN